MVVRRPVAGRRVSRMRFKVGAVMIRRSSSIGAWLFAMSSLATVAGEAPVPVEAPVPRTDADGPQLLLPSVTEPVSTAADAAPPVSDAAATGSDAEMVDAGPNSGGPGTSGDEQGAPAPAAEPLGSVGSRLPEVREGVGGIWAPEAGDDPRPVRVLPALVGRGNPKMEATAPRPDLPSSHDVARTRPESVLPKSYRHKLDRPLPVPKTVLEPVPVAMPKPVPGEPRPLPTLPVSRPIDPLMTQVDQAIEVTARRVLIAETNVPGERPHTPWQIGHAMLAYRQALVVKVNGKKVNAYDWVATNPIYRARVKRGGKDAPTTIEPLPWFYLTPHGARPQKFTGEGMEFEGHPNQFLAFFALARIPLEFEFTIQGRKVTFGQMLHNAKMEVNDREEVTWDLWTFAYYFDMNEQWRNAKGEAWSMERLVATTLRQFSPTKSPCGGCHGLFALASARNSYLQSGNRLSGVWMQAHMHLEKHIALAKAMQNEDGSFSGNYFKGPKYLDEPSTRISTTGHTLEFLMLALQQERLEEPWVRRAVAAVARDLVEHQQEPLEVGGMSHAVHALVLYRERSKQQLAEAPSGVRPISAAAEPVGTPIRK
jgi:hypothetical protein